MLRIITSCLLNTEIRGPVSDAERLSEFEAVERGGEELCNMSLSHVQPLCKEKGHGGWLPRYLFCTPDSCCLVSFKPSSTVSSASVLVSCLEICRGISPGKQAFAPANPSRQLYMPKLVTFLRLFPFSDREKEKAASLPILGLDSTTD